MFLNKKIAYFPLKTILGFLIFSEALFWIGPKDYNIDNGVILFFYLLILNLAFYIGYRNGYVRFKPSKIKISSLGYKLWIYAGLIVTFISALMFLKARGWSFSLSTLIASMSNPGEAYYTDTDEDALHSSNYFSVMLSPIKWATLPLGVYFWDKLSNFYKLLVILTFLIGLFVSLCSGVRKGLADTILIVIFCIIARIPNLIIIKKKRRKLQLYSISAIIIFLIYFIYSNISRSGGDGFESLSFFDISNIKSVYLDYLPFPLVIALAFITSYLCQGYFALAKGLSYGILSPTIFGSSFFLIRIAKDICGYDPTPDTYMWILQENEGISITINWHTLYLWLANDFTFLLVPIIIYYIGYFFSKTWCDAVYGKNAYAYPTFCLFLIMSFYCFANNQIFSFSFIPFFFWIILYYFSKHKVS